MLVFIDESGDPGFKLDKGASSVFVASMVIFSTSAAAAATQKIIDESEARRGHKDEFKFSKCSDDVREKFFASIGRCEFAVRAIVVQKDKIYSPRLMTNKDAFYEYFVKCMLKHNNGSLKDARVVIDGSGDREFRQNLNSALRTRVGRGVIKDVRFKDSKSDVLVQLADMCAGAIARSYKKRDDAHRWRNMIAKRIDDVWDFK